ncbi:hypothetical protein LIER_25804 [Lithospermum erythrorhizon]|uniref:Uncharacterized protein n=1 Tax=Lithospermum erythrorhizon TaxID=34254 RepID=A0AAV3R9C1_LITER
MKYQWVIFMMKYKGRFTSLRKRRYKDRLIKSWKVIDFSENKGIDSLKRQLVQKKNICRKSNIPLTIPHIPQLIVRYIHPPCYQNMGILGLIPIHHQWCNRVPRPDANAVLVQELLAA